MTTQPDQGLAALAQRLRADDPDRWAMAMLAAPPARPRLLTLYALNADLARTALSARDPLLAGMRVQWWVDRLAALRDAPPPPHELLSPLWSAWGAGAAAFAPLAEARLHDADREPFVSAEAVVAYADATGAALMAHAAQALGAADGPALRAQGRGAALVAWLRARPALQELGLGIARPDPGFVQSLAKAASAAFAQATAARRTIPRPAAPALYPGAAIRPALRAAATGTDSAAPSEFARRAALARLALTGRWWL